MFGIGVVELSIIFMIVVLIVGPLWGLLDAARRPDELFRAAGRSKVLWIALQFLFAPLGTLFYVIIALPSLKRESEKIKAEAQGPVWR